MLALEWIRLGDGLGGIDEPVFQSSDFTGGIWDAYPFTPMGGPVATAEQYVQASMAFNIPPEGDPPYLVDADGLIATLVIDTTGFAAGTSFELRLRDTGIGDSNFGYPADVTNGTINLVPEPAMMVQLFGLMAVMGPWFWLRKRNRNR